MTSILDIILVSTKKIYTNIIGQPPAKFKTFGNTPGNRGYSTYFNADKKPKINIL